MPSRSATSRVQANDPISSDSHRHAGREDGDGKATVARRPSSDLMASRRLVITVCPLEAGMVTLPIVRGKPARRLDARAVVEALRDLVTARRLEERVQVREGCAGGCGRSGPNIDVTVYPIAQPGQKPSHVAIGWKTYVYSLASLDYLAAVIEENLRPPRTG
jgi:hypothetical protein